MKEKLYRLFFRFLRLSKQKWCVARLDFSGAEISIIAENWREFNVRANSCKKEPETTEWLMDTCNQNEILYDIGANIGAYTLVAAALKAEVFAFEPSFSNYNRLNENVSLNNFDSNVKTFPIAFSRTKKMGQFQFLDSSSGSSACYYNESGLFNSKLKTIQSTKAILVYTLDGFVEEFNLPMPTLIKIDVDGAEMEIIEGGRKVMSSPHLKRAIIEVDLRIVQESDFFNLMSEFGFKLDRKFSRGADNVYNYTFRKN